MGNQTDQVITLRFFTCNDHRGFNPVPTASIIVASDEPMARTMLIDVLREQGINQDNDFTLKEIVADKPSVTILSNGDY
jgi:hypothetical protein